MAGRQRNDEAVAAHEGGRRADQECANCSFNHRCKGCLDFATRADPEHEEIATDLTSRLLHTSVTWLSASASPGSIIWAMVVPPGTKSCTSPSRFASNSRVSVVTPVRLPPGRLR